LSVSTYSHWRLLCRCLSIETGPGSTDLRDRLGRDDFDPLQLAAIANADFVAPSLYEALMRKALTDSIPTDFADYLAFLHRQNVIRNARIRAQCWRIGELLNTHGLRAVLLKGCAWLFDGSEAQPRERMIRDIDIILPRTDLPRAVAVLRSNGYADSSDSFAEHDHFHYPPLIPAEGEAVVELHRDLGCGLRDLPTDTVLATAVQVGPGLFIPSVACRALHNVLHAQIQNADRIGGQIPLRDLLDLAWLAAHGSQGWAELAGTRRLRLAIDESLLMAERLLGAEQPAANRPPGWRPRLHLARCVAQRRWPPLDAAGRRLGELARGLNWERDAYVPDGSVSRKPGAVAGRLVRRMARTATGRRAPGPAAFADDAALPRILIAILAKQKAPVLPLYLKCIEALDYPKSKLHLHIRTNNNTDDTAAILAAWVERVGNAYGGVEMNAADVTEPVEQFGVHEWNPLRFSVLGRIRAESIERAVALGCRFYFVADVDNFVVPRTLRALVELDLPIVAPLVRHARAGSRYANFHAKVDENGYFLDCPEYDSIVQRRQTGVLPVDVVHCTYLVRCDAIPSLRYEDGSRRYEYVIFSDSARRAGIPQFIDNRTVYGYLTLDETTDGVEALLGMSSDAAPVAA
jgi:hypothetical protein